MATFEDAAVLLDSIAEELEAAVKHGRVAARHFRERDVPRGCAHALALAGHLHTARGTLDSLAVLHAGHASTD